MAQLRYWAGIRLKGLRRTTNNFCQDICCPALGSNLTLVESVTAVEVSSLILFTRHLYAIGFSVQNLLQGPVVHGSSGAECTLLRYF
jgi:hypothetical protein